MATITEPPPVAPIAPNPAAPPVATLPEGVPAASYYRLSLEQYHAMAEAGILHPGDRVELLEGIIVTKMTKNSPHIRATVALNRFLGRTLPDGWCFGTETPIAVPTGRPGRDNEPEPDVTVMRGGADDYAAHRPSPADVALVIEIADASLAPDRTTKRALYARAGIPTYWIVNIPGRRVEVYNDPTGPADLPDYRASRFYGPDEEVSLVIGGAEAGRIAVRDLVPA